jgi:hypothetical protein
VLSAASRILAKSTRPSASPAGSLAPLAKQIPKAEFRRLVLAIRAAIGIEALVWLTDVAGLSRQEAIKNMRWSAQSLLEAILARAAVRER